MGFHFMKKDEDAGRQNTKVRDVIRARKSAEDLLPSDETSFKQNMLEMYITEVFESVCCILSSSVFQVVLFNKSVFIEVPHLFLNSNASLLSHIFLPLGCFLDGCSKKGL